jgi:hypothetical protein
LTLSVKSMNTSTSGVTAPSTSPNNFDYTPADRACRSVQPIIPAIGDNDSHSQQHYNTSPTSDNPRSAVAPTGGVGFGVIRSRQGTAKRFDLADDRTLVKTSGGNIAFGQYQTFRVEDLAGYSEFLQNQLPSDAVITLGTYEGSEGVTPLTTSKRVKAGEIGIARTRDYFTRPSSPYSFMLLDIDPEPGQAPLTPAELRAVMARVIPDFESIGVLIVDGSSSHIYTEAGECLRGAGSYHMYLMVQGDIASLRGWLKTAFWLAGYGRFRLAEPNAKTGIEAILERFPIDLAVFDYGRMIFENPPTLGAGLVQQRQPHQLIEGGALDIMALPPHTAEQKAEARRLYDAAKAPLLADRLNRTAERYERSGMAPTSAREAAIAAIAAVDSRTLTPDTMLYLPGGAQFKTVGELRPADIDTQICDPQEPQYRDWAQTAVIKSVSRWGATIKSQAHGGQRFVYQPPTSGRGFQVIDGGADGDATECPIEERKRAIADRTRRFELLHEVVELDYRIKTGGSTEYRGGMTTQTAIDGIHTYEGYSPQFEFSELAATVFLQGWLAAGKTESTIHSIAAHCMIRPVVWNSPRNGLNRNTISRFSALYPGVPVYFYQDDVSKYKSLLHNQTPGLYVFAPQSYKSYSVGPDSYPNSEGLDWSNIIVICDEFSGIRQEILGYSSSIIEFERMMRDCHTLVCADAFLSQADISIVRGYRQQPELIMTQEFKPAPDKIHLVETLTKDGRISMSNGGAALALVDGWLSEGVTQNAIASDNLAAIQIIDAHIAEKYPQLKRSITSSKTPEESRRVMTAPDRHYEIHQINIASLSPTAQSGVDIQTPFDRGLVIAAGVLPPTQIIQIMKRFRQCRDWWVVCPRKTAAAPAIGAIGGFSIDKLSSYAVGALQAFDGLELSEGDVNREIWGTWQDVQGKIAKSFNREYLEHLYRTYFADVETVYVNVDGFCGREIALRDRVKNREATAMLAANLENGQMMIDAEQAAHYDGDVWDIALATLHRKFPATIGGLIDGEVDDESIGVMRIYSSSRIDKLRNWRIAEDAGFTDREMLAAMQGKTMHGTSRPYQAYRNTRMYRELNLGELARCQSQADGADHATHYSVLSPVVTELWEMFAGSDLRRQFPQIETKNDFWEQVKRTLSFMGFQKLGGVIRIVVSQFCKNGYHRDGSPRESKSKTVWHTGWLKHEASGSKLFGTLFGQICADLDAWIGRDRAASAQRQAAQSPPPAWAPDPLWDAA